MQLNARLDDDDDVDQDEDDDVGDNCVMTACL